MEWVVNATPRPLYPPKDPVPIVQEAVWALGTVWTGAENRAPTGTRSSDPPARSESLYWLSYPGSNNNNNNNFLNNGPVHLGIVTKCILWVKAECSYVMYIIDIMQEEHFHVKRLVGACLPIYTASHSHPHLVSNVSEQNLIDPPTRI